MPDADMGGPVWLLLPQGLLQVGLASVEIGGAILTGPKQGVKNLSCHWPPSYPFLTRMRQKSCEKHARSSSAGPGAQFP